MMTVIIPPVHVVLASFEDTGLCWKKAYSVYMYMYYKFVLTGYLGRHTLKTSDSSSTGYV